MDDQQDDPPPRWNRGNYPFFTKVVSGVLYGRQQPDQRRPKRDSLRAKQRTKRIWNAITKAYPADHIQRKTELCDALRRFETAASEAARSREAALDYEANHEALNFENREMARLCGDSVAKSIQHLRRLLSAIHALQRVDTTAEPINFMLNHYNRLVQPERNRIDDDVRALGYWVVSANRHAGHKATANRRERLQRAVYDAQRNHGFFRFGGGNQSSQLGVWVESDEFGNIVDRTVVKDAYMNYSFVNTGWKSEIYWRDPEDYVNKIPKEVAIMLRLNEAGSENVVRLRSWRGFWEKLMYRMHLEYCPYGDISRLQDTHSEEVRWIPEPAIWYILECLANAGAIFHQGDINVPRNDWTEEIVHRDLKPENVFMGEFPEPVPTGDNWVCYPTVKVGDYGLAIETSDQDIERNPNQYRGIGTEGFLAPEQHPVHPDEDDEISLNEKTNVWGVGMTVMELMARHEMQIGEVNDEEEEDSQNPPETPSDPHPIPVLQPLDQQAYSPDLVNLVKSCVSKFQEERPTFARLRARIRFHTGLADTPEPDYAAGARTSTVAQRSGSEISLRLLRRDQYALGLSLPGLRLAALVTEQHRQNGAFVNAQARRLRRLQILMRLREVEAREREAQEGEGEGLVDGVMRRSEEERRLEAMRRAREEMWRRRQERQLEREQR